MSRILALEDCSTEFRNSLLRILTESDEAVLLPQSERSIDSSSFKNVVFRIDADRDGVNPEIFNPKWFDGITCVQLDDRDVEPFLKDHQRRLSAHEALASAIPSEVSSLDITVGPPLDADENDMDLSYWVAGFDGPSCCVGLYIS